MISISTVFVNKNLLSAQEDFDAPLFVTWFQCIFTFVVCLVLRKFHKKFSSWGLPQFSDSPFTAAKMVKVRI